MKNTKYINCGNDFYNSYFERLCEELESGQRVEVGIACIGHTRNNMSQEAYKDALVKKYGDRLEIKHSGGGYSYHYEYELK